MHVAILTNTAWLDDELPQLRPLVVGLIDEQVRVAQVVPLRLSEDDTSAFGERITWQEHPWGWLNTRRVVALAEKLEEAEVDLLHIMHGRMWAAGLQLAQKLDLPIALSIASSEEVEQAASLLRSRPKVRIAFAAATNTIGKSLNERLGPDAQVHVIPLGAHVVKADVPPTPDGVLCAVVVGNGEYDEDYRELLDGIALYVQLQPEAQFFFDTQEGDQHRTWREANKRGLSANMSLAPHRLGHRELLLRADVILQPQALSRARSLTLSAMAAGLPIIAKPDSWLDYLVDDQTAWLCKTGLAAEWHELIKRVADDEPSARKLGQSAQQWIAARHTPAKQVSLMISMYRRLTGEAFKFSEAS